MQQAIDEVRYVIITPMKDEEKYVERTLKSVTAQTILPSLWLIADDGSKDASAAIVKRYAQRHSWIRLWRTGKETKRDTNAAEIRVFNQALRTVDVTQYGFIIKLDCDLDLPKDYFRMLIGRFLEDRALGIASGVYCEELHNRWRAVSMPAYHAAGASKVLRTECFQQIGGFVPYRGWDTVDEIKAQSKGWKTSHFPDLQFLHLKKEGSGMGLIRTGSIHGEISYVTRTGLIHFIFKFAHRLIRGKPRVLSALAMGFGYVKAWATGRPRLVEDNEAAVYRRLLYSAMWGRICRPLGIARTFGVVSSSESSLT